MKISARLREQAAFVLDVMASTPDLMCRPIETSIRLGFDGYGLSDPQCTADLASRAYFSVWKDSFSSAVNFAEAAQRLREGWTP